MLFVVAIVVLAVVSVLAWKALWVEPAGPPRRVSAARRPPGPDDDPDFLRGLAERNRRDRDEPPTA